ncbi:hypothetical protein BAE44_0003424 [Dichanthelium oligosanthes]|uniref:Reverse transcriptase zinc-binding domain-containing protein n=1 Tax=Dichanthelium oligosanthes TaxID=888268 RepID=A0A1E5WDT5_9POAL|nr:hypothetical protein BAE44_0003424 [Dichanthelium oligosanthes]
MNDRVQSKVNLHKKTIVPDVTCEICCNNPETANHIMFECSFPYSFWTKLGFQLPTGQQVRELHMIPKPEHVPAEHYAGLSYYAAGNFGSEEME